MRRLAVRLRHRLQRRRAIRRANQLQARRKELIIRSKDAPQRLFDDDGPWH